MCEIKKRLSSVWSTILISRARALGPVCDWAILASQVTASGTIRRKKNLWNLRILGCRMREWHLSHCVVAKEETRSAWKGCQPTAPCLLLDSLDLREYAFESNTWKWLQSSSYNSMHLLFQHLGAEAGRLQSGGQPWLHSTALTQPPQVILSSGWVLRRGSEAFFKKLHFS